MRPAVLATLVMLAAPAVAQRAPAEETRPTSPPPAVRFEQKPETLDSFRTLMCPRNRETQEQSSEQADKPTVTEHIRPDGCRIVPPKRELHPDYGKGKFYDLTPA